MKNKNLKQTLAIAAVCTGLLTATGCVTTGSTPPRMIRTFYLTKAEREKVENFIPEEHVNFKRNYVVETSDMDKIIERIEFQPVRVRYSKGMNELMKSDYSPTSKEGYFFFTNIEEYKKNSDIGGYLMEVNYFGEKFRDVNITIGGNLSSEYYRMIMQSLDALIEGYAVDID